MNKTIHSHSTADTQKIAKDLISSMIPRGKGATVVALEGELGAGKTTFTQALASALGVTENVLSPTFVLLKIYQLPKGKQFKHLIHIDCYRVDDPKDLAHLGLDDILRDQDAIVVIEWADRVRDLLPDSTRWIHLDHGDTENERTITL